MRVECARYLRTTEAQYIEQQDLLNSLG